MGAGIKIEFLSESSRLEKGQVYLFLSIKTFYLHVFSGEEKIP
jgi:hypothetical protein